MDPTIYCIEPLVCGRNGRTPDKAVKRKGVPSWDALLKDNSGLGLELESDPEPPLESCREKILVAEPRIECAIRFCSSVAGSGDHSFVIEWFRKIEFGPVQ